MGIYKMPKFVKKHPSEMKLRRIQPDRKVKKNHETLMKPRQFDIIGEWISNYGMTGANLTQWIFSYLDFSSLQQGRLVRKGWCHFLTYDWVMWRNMLMKAKPYLENLFNKLSNDKYMEISDAYRKLSKDVFERIKKQGSLPYKQRLKLFGKIQSIMVIIQRSNFQIGAGCDLRLHMDLKYNLIGNNLFQEILGTVDKRRPQNSFCHFFRIYLEQRHRKIRYILSKQPIDEKEIERDLKRIFGYLKKVLISYLEN